MHHKYNWTIAEAEDLYPFEFDVYTALLLAHLEEERRMMQDQQARGGA